MEDTLRKLLREELKSALKPLHDALSTPQSPSPPPPPSRQHAELLTTSEAAALARVTPDTIRTWVATNKLPGFRSGRRVLVRRTHLMDLLRTTGNDPIAGAVQSELRLLKLTD